MNSWTTMSEPERRRDESAWVAAQEQAAAEARERCREAGGHRWKHLGGRAGAAARHLSRCARCGHVGIASMDWVFPLLVEANASLPDDDRLPCADLRAAAEKIASLVALRCRDIVAPGHAKRIRGLVRTWIRVWPWCATRGMRPQPLIAGHVGMPLPRGPRLLRRPGWAGGFARR